MRPASWLPLIAIAVALPACSSSSDTDASEADTDTDTDIDTDTDGDTDDTDEPVGFDSSFVAGRYRMTKLLLAASDDTDGDEVIDNNLSNVLNTVDTILQGEDFSTAMFNVRMQENLDNYVTVVLTDARYIDYELQIDMLQGQADENLALTIKPASYDSNGDPRVQFLGTFTSEELMWAETPEMTFPVSFVEDDEPLPVTLEIGRIDGALTDDTFGGTLIGVLPIDELMEKVVDPMIPDSGYDYDNDGDLDAKQDILDLIWSIAPAAGDVDLGGGRVGVSAVFSFEAKPATWAR